MKYERLPYEDSVIPVVNELQEGPAMKRHYNRAHPGTVSGAPKQNPEAYRGYTIHFSALNNRMWIEKGAAHIASVPDNKSWAWARSQIDELVRDAS